MQIRLLLILLDNYSWKPKKLVGVVGTNYLLLYSAKTPFSLRLCGWNKLAQTTATEIFQRFRREISSMGPSDNFKNSC